MSWSLTSLSTYEKCPAQYKYRYIDRLEGTLQSAAASRGSAIHSAFEQFLNGTITELPNEVNFYTSFCKALKQGEFYPEHTIVLNRGWEPTGGDSEDRWYKGILDVKILQRLREGEDPTEATVIDWKTGKIYPEHDDQKSLYSLAVFAEHPSVRRVRAQHIYVDIGKEREKVYDRDQVHELRSAWERRVEKLESEKEWIPTPQYGCRYCPYSKSKGGPCRF